MTLERPLHRGPACSALLWLRHSFLYRPSLLPQDRLQLCTRQDTALQGATESVACHDWLLTLLSSAVQYPLCVQVQPVLCTNWVTQDGFAKLATGLQADFLICII